MKKLIRLIAAIVLFTMLALPTSAQEAVVGPLLQTQWSQRTPYNDLFPIVRESDGFFVDNNSRNVTGCGTTAFAQIMKFHNYPARGSGQSTSMNSYPKSITVPLVDLNVAYDWKNMLNTYTTTDPGTEQQRNAVATLMYHIAAATGANNSSTKAMITNFGYDKSIQIHYRKYADADWEALIKQQLDTGLPVLYWGDDPEEPGHTFVIDGYDNIGRFHINMGWGGVDDGWYFLNNINPSTYGTKKFYNNQLIYINIKPDAGSTGSNKLALNTFTTDKAAVSQNEQFTVKFELYSSGFFSGGQVGAVLVDNDSKIITVIGERTVGNNWQPGSKYIYEINGSVPVTVEPGEYQLRIAVKTAASDWEFITLSAVRDGVSNSIDFGVIMPGATGTVKFATADGNGMVTASVDGKDIASGDLVEHGKKAIFRATPDDSYRIAGWTVNGMAVLGNATETLEITHFRSETIVNAIFVKKDLYYYVSTYANATEDMVINVDGNFKLDSSMIIPAPAKAGATLTIKSTDPSVPATLLRGTDGSLFTVPNGATLILKDIIIDGDAKGDFANGRGALASVSGKLVMENGAVLRNNVNSGNGGGVYIYGGLLTMNGGEISGNTAGGNSGGVYVYNGTLTMNGGKINGNNSGTYAGGVFVYNSNFTMNGGKVSGNNAGSYNGGIFVYNGDFTMTGGEIIGNAATTSTTGRGIYIYGESTANIKGGVIAGIGTTINNVVYGTYVNNGNTAIIAWNKPAGNIIIPSAPGTSTNLTVSQNATAVWANKDGNSGISYANGENTGFITISEMNGTTPIHIANNPSIKQIKIQTIGKTIALQNLPANAKIEIYNLQGKRIYSANHENPKILKIGVQTGVYIVKAGNQTLKVAVR